MHRVGIESDQLVYDYLSRVGDLAQRQQLSSGARMRLVSTLRGEIDRQRGTERADSPAAVRRIIGRLGSPDELVAAAAESADGTIPLPSARPPAGAGGQRRTLPGPRSGLLRKQPKEPAPGRSEDREGRAERPPRKPKAGFGRGASHPAPGDDDGGAAGDAADSAPHGVFGGDPGGGPRGDSGGDPRSGLGGDPGGGYEGASGSTRSAAVPRPAPAPDDDVLLDAPHAPDDVPARDWPDPSAPHMLGQDQRGDADGAADWWRLEPGPFDEGTAIPGFFGGIEAPELLGKRPRPGESESEAEDERGEKGEKGAAKTGRTGEAGETGDVGDAEGGGVAGTARRRRALRLVKLRRRKSVAVAAPEAAARGPRGGFAHPLLLLAAVLLVAGVVTGSWLPLAGGWLIAYSSRTLSRTEAKWAALGLPGVVVAGALVWVWGRLEGRWGEPIRDGAMRDVLLEAWPVVIRVAALASALYLLWRSRRRAG
ncbi:hypothetical protein [Streptomyces sp. NPDC091649]|uniref:hypothetical protein n=1 Tax=Streptomyces sp. NPDC091649 TaxID=3366004 RepID=UPI003801884B